MDHEMTDESVSVKNNRSTISLRAYMNQYTGQQRFTRLISIIDRAAASNLSDHKFQEAADLAYELASSERNLGMFKRVQQSIVQHFKHQNKNVPAQFSGNGKINEVQLQNEHNLMVRNKDQDIQKQMKQLIKDSMRISLKELGFIYFNNGFLQEAQNQWVKSLDMSISNDDMFKMRYILAKSTFINSQDHLVGKFSQEALAQDNGHNQEISTILKILDAFSIMRNENNMKLVAQKLLGVQISDDQDQDNQQKSLSEITSHQDIAYYVCLASLSSFNRKELRDQVLKSKNFNTVTEGAGKVSLIIEQFLNGNYQQFQENLHQIQEYLKYDPFFGEHCQPKIFKQIRMKALQQHVSSYKIIDINEIAEEFEEPVQQIENDLIQLIKSGQLNYKINQYKKTLQRCVPNQKLNMLKQINFKSEHYIINSEIYLLKMRLQNVNFQGELKDEIQSIQIPQKQ